MNKAHPCVLSRARENDDKYRVMPYGVVVGPGRISRASCMERNFCYLGDKVGNHRHALAFQCLRDGAARNERIGDELEPHRSTFVRIFEARHGFRLECFDERNVAGLAVVQRNKE